MLRVRWMIRIDMPGVLAIERCSFNNPWSEDEFIRCLRQRNTIGMVCECERNDKKVLGYMIYELHHKQVYLLRIAVDPVMRRKGIGSALVEKLVSKLSMDRRNSIALDVRETNLAAQLFFKKLGFEAKCIFPDYYEDTSEDAYLMKHIYREPFVPEVATKQNSFNIIQNWFRHFG